MSEVPVKQEPLFKPAVQRFTTVYNSLIEDTRLSLQARMIQIYLLSKPQGWVIRIADLEAKTGLTENTLYKHLKELKEHGYLVMQRRSDGKVEYQIVHLPDPNHKIAQQQNLGGIVKTEESKAVNTDVADGKKKNKKSTTDRDLLGDLPSDKKESLKKITQEAIDTFNASPLVKRNEGLHSEVLKLTPERMKQVQDAIPMMEVLAAKVLESKTVTPELWKLYWISCNNHEFYSGRTGPSNGHKPIGLNGFAILLREKTIEAIYNHAEETEESVE